MKRGEGLRTLAAKKTGPPPTSVLASPTPRRRPPAPGLEPPRFPPTEPLTRPVSLVVWIKTESEKNLATATIGGRMAQATRTRKKRVATRAVLDAFSLRPPLPPLDVSLVRVSPAFLDDDNVARALSPVRDAIAAYLGVNDRRRELVAYGYDQWKAPRGSRPCVVIELRPRGASCMIPR